MDIYNQKRVNRLRFVVLISICILLVLSVPISMVLDIWIKLTMMFLMGMMLGVIIVAMSFIVDIERGDLIYRKL